jgi:tetratricopeptide (TPR) repeat protein
MIFCQRCKTSNPLEAEHCVSCGTRLLIISGAQDNSALLATSDHTLEEHLLERISTLEAALGRMQGRFEQLLELAQQQATGSFYDHMMIEALSEILAETGLVSTDELEQRWRVRVARHYEETIERERLDERCGQIISNFRGPMREEFINLVEEGAQLVSEGHPRRGLRLLEQALALDEQNIELIFTVGECYFQFGKATDATGYLRRVVALDDNHFGARLLLGLLSGDAGESELAKLHLQHALALDKDSFAAHYGLGRLLACEGKISAALAHLKRALALKPTPEMHYLVGRAYWEQGQAERALKHLRKAVRLDPRFDAALYSLGWLYWQSNRPNEAREHFRAAYEINPRDSHYRVAVQARAGDELPQPPAPGWTNIIRRRRTANSETRFIDLLRRDLSSVALAPAPLRKNPRK